jgi:CheY-like chemotaxis protein
MLILCIDNEPGRFDHFTHIIEKNHPEIRWIIGCHPLDMETLLEKADAILLDHDMPFRNGVDWAKHIAASNIKRIPIVIVSTTSNTTARETMEEILKGAGFKVIRIPADHQNCEVEWLWWIKGAISQ